MSGGSGRLHGTRDFGDDPWSLVTTGLAPELAAEDETLFALANGYLGMRGTHEEGAPLGAHGTFINGVHETWPIEHAESAYGFAEVGQTIVNVPDAQTIRIYVDDERLNLDASEVREVRRELDLRAGTLERSLLWLTPTGKRVRVHTRRLVSFESCHLATIELSVTVENASAAVAISSLLVNRQDLGRLRAQQAPGVTSPGDADPRKSTQLTERILDPGPGESSATRTVQSYRVRHSGIGIGVGIDHVISAEGTDGDDREVTRLWARTVEGAGDRVRHRFTGTADQGETITLHKTITYHSSETAALSELLDRCTHTLADTAAEPSEARWQAQRAFLTEFWERSDVRVEAEPGVQQAIRWNLFQLAQGAARADGRGIPAKGLTGSGYSGHYFWDAEIYVLPFLTYTSPQWARNALRARLRMLPQARRRAAMLNEDGALFPWRTINGEEASAYYAAGTAQYHINADITFALARYTWASGDRDFILSGAGDIAIETARMWATLGFWRPEPNGDPQFHIHGVTGPDEYTTVVNDNLFTNVMARFNLRCAVEVVRDLEATHPEAHRALIARLGVTDAEVDAWAKAADGMCVPFDDHLGIHPQDAHFLEREVWDLAATPPEQKPLLLHFHPLVIYRFQVLKQADVVLALLLASDEFSREEKRRDFEYYDALTTGDSTLSAVVQAIMAAEVGYRQLADEYFAHALRVDLDNLHRNSADGVHIASAGGVWMALVQGFAGMRDTGRELAFDPRLPAAWGSLSFALEWRGNRIGVELRQRSIQFTHLSGDTPVAVRLRGAAVRIAVGAAVECALAGQGPDLGVFSGLSAARLPREGHEGEQQEGAPLTQEIPIVTTVIPTREG